MTLTNKELPLVSVVMISYNQEKFIRSSIESVLLQEYQNIEIVISDDASTDGTVKIIKEYAEKYPNKFNVITSKKNVGPNENWFKAVIESRGKYAIGLAGDDEFLPDIISEYINIMEEDSNIAICYSDAIVFDTNKQKVLYKLSDKAPTSSGGIDFALSDAIYYSPTLMFRRKLVPEENIFLGIRSGSDIAFYKEIMILSRPNRKIHYINKPLYKYQKHDKNITTTQSSYRREHIECIRILQNKYPEYKELLMPSIYDFCCVAFFKSIFKMKIRDAFYFLSTGLRASSYNVFKFFRAINWAMSFYKKILLNNIFSKSLNL